MFAKISKLLVVRPTFSFVPAQTLRAIDSLDAPSAVAGSAVAARQWAPASSGRIEMVTNLVGAGVMAYFAAGLLATLI